MGMSSRQRAGNILGILALILLGVSSAPAQRIEEWVRVTYNGQPLRETAPIINGKAFLPLVAAAQRLGVSVRYDPVARCVAMTGGEGPEVSEPLKAELARSKTDLDKARADLAAEQQKSKALEGTNATLKQENTRLQGENVALREMVDTANYFGYTARCLGRSIERNDGRPRERNQYWGIVTFCGQDLLVVLPRGGANDASAVEKAQSIARKLNDIFSRDRALQPEWFVTHTEGARHAIAYRGEGGEFNSICGVDPEYADMVFNWLRGQEKTLPIPEAKRLRSAKDAEELIRDWWLAELRDCVALVRELDFAAVAGTTTATKEAGEIFKSVIRPRLRQNPFVEGQVAYPPLQVINIISGMSPAEKLKTYDIFHEGGLLDYLMNVWTRRP